MAEHTASLSAEIGTAELHHEPAAFGIAASGWVALSMLAVVAILLWKRVPALVGAMLDKRIAAIRAQLDDAATLRAEAEALLAQARARAAASEADAQAIMRNAEAEAAALRAKAEAEAADLIARRARMAEDKIAAAERAAIQAIRVQAADTATSAAAAIISDNHDAGADRALVDSAIAAIGRPH